MEVLQRMRCYKEWGAKKNEMLQRMGCYKE